MSPWAVVQCPVKPVETRHTSRASQTTLYNERETWARFRLCGAGTGTAATLHWGQSGDTNYYTGCVGSLNQYEIASFMRVVSQSSLSVCCMYLASSDLSVSLLSDVSSFASKSRTDIIRTRLETCSAHIRSPSLTGSVTHSRKKRKRGKNWNLVEFPITWNWFLCDHKGFYLVQQSPPPPQQLCLTRTLGYFSKVRGGRNVIPAQRKRPFSAIKSVI